jgi:tetratricopeptide (TPR) repeat protein
MRRGRIPTVIRIETLVALLLIWGCAPFRAEFYRHETQYLYTRGATAYRNGNAELARRTMVAVLDQDSTYAPAEVVLGHIAFARGDISVAEAHYRRALKGDPELVSAVFPMMIRCRTQRYRQGATTLKMILDLMAAEDDAAYLRALADCKDLETLARDPFSVAPDERMELNRLVVTRLLTRPLSPQEELFSGFFLYETGAQDPLAAKTVRAWLSHPEHNPARRSAWITLIGLYRRMGDSESMSDAFNEALSEGFAAESLMAALEGAHVLPISTVEALQSQYAVSVSMPDDILSSGWMVLPRLFSGDDR